MSSSGILSNSSNRKFSVSVSRPDNVFPSTRNNTTLSSNYLPSAFAVQSIDKRSDASIDDSSGATCHMTNATNNMYSVRLPLQTNRKS